MLWIKKIFQVQDLYIEAVGAKSDAEQRKVLVDDLTKMSKLKLQIDEMQNRLKTISIDGVGLVVPDLPKEIKSDSYGGSGDDIMMTTDFVYKGGLNFNWHNIKPEDGYFKSINNKSINPGRCVEDRVDQRRLRRIRDPGHRDEPAQREGNVHVLQVVLRGADDGHGLAVSGARTAGTSMTSFPTGSGPSWTPQW